jgi:hypothetical protein
MNTSPILMDDHNKTLLNLHAAYFVRTLDWDF